MSRTTLSLLAAALVVAAAPARAADDPQDRLMKMLFAKLHKILIPPPPSGTKARDVPVLLLNVPGTPLPLNYKPSNSDEDAKSVNMMFDLIPRVGPFFEPTGLTRYSDVYNLILHNSVVDEAKMTPEERTKEEAEVAKLEAELDPDSAYYASYKKARDAYSDAVVALDQNTRDRKSQGLGPLDKYKIELRDAMSTYQSKETALRKKQKQLSQFLNKDSLAWIEKLKGRYNDHWKGDGNLDTNFYPKFENWSDQGGWMSFSFSTAETASSESQNDLSVQAAASINAGKLSASANVSYATTAMANASGGATTTISFKLKRVFIIRNYMDGQLFSNYNWKFNDNNRNFIVSNGETMKTLDGKMPLITTTAILCKDLSIKGNWVAEFKKAASKELKVDAKVSYGPFSASANYRDFQSSASAAKKVDADELGDDGGIQIIAWLATIVPKSPNYHGDENN